MTKMTPAILVICALLCPCFGRSGQDHERSNDVLHIRLHGRTLRGRTTEGSRSTARSCDRCLGPLDRCLRLRIDIQRDLLLAFLIRVPAHMRPDACRLPSGSGMTTQQVLRPIRLQPVHFRPGKNHVESSCIGSVRGSRVHRDRSAACLSLQRAYVLMRDSPIQRISSESK